ncbi:type ISP restriction/modification enzyme [Methylocapsa sp. S129]|uniref:type ISP restriction/modification enzyme n=1 Tax=Methylocapsa sp. S129 TaxID=1641869 RepID=UPI00131C57BA|nr:type ISP restriction/modification enzyme [Methylocapsa sp. S129]
MTVTFDAYLRKIRETPLAEHTEHTGRSALEVLLGQFAGEAAGREINVQHEPKREADKGAPDFKIKRRGMILGYVEVKEIGANLDKVLKSGQIRRYRELSDNILLTDYLQWVWIDRERVKGREILAYPTDLEGRTLRITPERAEAVAKLIAAFFSEAPQGIGRAQQLALALAARSRLLRDYLGEELVRQEREHREGRLYGLFQIFRDQVFHELTLKEFSDAFAQMLAYGLFLARLNSDSEPVTLHNARQYVPGSFRLIRELVDFLAELEKDEYRNVRWVIEEVLSIVNGLDLPSIHEDLSFRHRKAISRKVRAADAEEHRLFERDPFIYFYEDYLRAYDPAMRKGRGVYYTPPPIVNFIVRAVDDILKESFGIRDGLADHQRVTVLDFACGTGTFLLEVFQRIFDNIGGPEVGRANLIVRKHMLKNLFGFEYLIAPYTIAHLKLSQYLRDQGHPISGDERLQVFLTNTLEQIEPQANFLLPAISAEVEAAQKVKDRQILVITGNPPYSGLSKNKGVWITEKIEDYKYVDGHHFGERKHWLQDDYVKFIRFAQSKMDEVPQGIVAIITNHAWIYNPTFRGMRQSLLNSFQQIHVIDLHGSSKPKERAPDGSQNENVFDIMKGVAITLFVKRPGLKPGVLFGDVWGSRLGKYEICAASNYEALASERVEPTSPFYFFSPHAPADIAGWPDCKSLEDIFTVQSSGMLTARDRLNVAFDSDELLERLGRFANMDFEVARKEFRLGADTRDWKVALAQEDLHETTLDPKFLRLVSYRPFDHRFVFYTGQSKGLIGQPGRLLAEAIDVSGVALGTTRRVEEGDFQHAFAYSHLPDGHSVSSKEMTHVFPLFLNQASFGNASSDSRIENIALDFRAFIDSRYDHHFTPEEIFGYIYAALYAPTYRTRYAEFLRTDFPRIPFSETKEAFETLSKLGWTLVQAHILGDFPRQGLAAYHGKGNHTVEAVRYAPAEEAVWINKAQFFKPVPQAVWNFHIGGYQVIEKYLKSRRGRILSLDEITHISAVADSLAFTIQQVAKIDDPWRSAFPDRG